jgi:F-type H+-transporting ATPase subunit b
MHELFILAAEAAHGSEGGEHHAEAMAFGFLTPGMVVALAMLSVFIIMWRAGVPKMVTGMLDGRIAEIRKQLDEAKALRAEAEALRKQYADKIAGAEKDAEAMLSHAREEAGAILAKVESDATALIARRRQIAEDKIAAAERSAVAELRAKAAQAASEAAQGLIAKNHSASADKALVDQAIGSI